MASRAIQISKVLILVLAIVRSLHYILGWSSSVVRRSQRSSDLIAQLQELLKDFNEADFLPGRCDTAAIAALIRQQAQEIRELTLSNAAATFNCNCSCNGGYASYLLPVASLVAMGFCYMWCKGWSFSDVMSVTKQLENVNEKVDSTRRHLTEGLEVLGRKVEEQNDLNQRNAKDVSEVKLNLSQDRLSFGSVLKNISRMDGELKLAEIKQDMTISGLRGLGQWIVGLYKEQNRNVSEGLQTIGIEGTSSKTIIQRPYQIKIPQDGGTCECD